MMAEDCHLIRKQYCLSRTAVEATARHTFITIGRRDSPTA